MPTSDTERVNINGLLPETNYVVQVRAVNDAGHSKWSQKFNILTVEDTLSNTRKPKTPTSVTWTYNNQGFHGTWNAVTQNTDNSNAKIVQYGVELIHSGTTKIVQVEAEDGTVRFDLPLQRAQVLFNVPTISTLDMRVRAVNATGTKSDWSSVLNIGAAAPDPPTSAVVTPTIDGVKLSWTAPVNTTNVNGYRVYAGTVVGFTPAPTNRIYQGTGTSCTFNSTTYSVHYFKIRSYSDWGQESTDLTASGTPISPYAPDAVAPSVPTSLAVTVNRTGSTARAQVSWAFTATGSDSDIQAFAVRFRKVGDTIWFVEFADKAARDMYVDLPQPYANYEFQIAAVDFVANHSAWSSTVTLSAGIPGSPPQTVGVTAVPGLGSVQLQWTPSTHDDVTYGGYYDVDIATNSGFSTGLLSYKTGNTSISITGLPLDTVYYYRVRAVDVDGNAGTYSTTANTTTLGVGPTDITDGTIPSSSPAATATGGVGAIYVSWPPTSNADPVTYEVYMGTTAGFTPSGGNKVAETSGTTVSIVKDGGGTNLVFGTSYYVKVRARDGDGPAASYGTVSSAATLATDVTSVAIDQIAAGSISAVTFTLASSGVIQSANYVAATSGFKLSSSVVDIQSGIVNFGTLAAGTVTTTGLSIGAGGRLTVDSTGAIQSNNYSAGVTGWKLSSTGFDLPGMTVSAGNIIAGTYTGGNFIVGSGGAIRSSNWNGSSIGWSLDYNGLTIYSGTVYSASVQTNQLTSIATDSTTGLPLFSINSGGFATLAGAKILGNTILGSASSTSHYIQSYNFSTGSTGWKIDATGAAQLNNIDARGSIMATGTFPYSIRMEVPGNLWSNPSPRLALYNTRTYPGQFVANSGSLLISPPNNTGPGTTGYIALYETGIGVEIGGGLEVLGGLTFDSSMTPSNSTISGPSVTVEVTNGALKFTSGGNVAGRLGTTFSGSAVTFRSTWVAATTDTMNATTPTAANTVDFYCKDITRVNNNAYSDRKLKKEISDIDGDWAVEVVKKMRMRQFKLKTDSDDAPWRYGVVAQELEKVLPDVVGDSGDGTRTVNYENAHNVETAALQNLIARLEAAEAKIAELQK